MTPTPDHQPSERRSPVGDGRTASRAVVRVGVFAMVGGVIAALIWMKLKVVGGVPRTAYADPEEERPSRVVQPTPSPAREAPDSDRPSPER